jgi:hypothetical protein
MYFRNVVRCSALIATLSALVGCGDRPSTTAPALKVNRALASLTGSTLTRGMIVKRTINLNEDITATATITRHDGGMMWIEEAGFFLYFPKNAVSSDLVVTVTAYKGNRVIYSFEPHGTVFEAPVYVGQALLNTELNTPRSAKQRPPLWAGYLANGLDDVALDGTGKFSEAFDAFYYGKGNDAFGVFTIMHFSGYAMASGRRETSSDE